MMHNIIPLLMTCIVILLWFIIYGMGELVRTQKDSLKWTKETLAEIIKWKNQDKHYHKKTLKKMEG